MLAGGVHTSWGTVCAVAVFVAGCAHYKLGAEPADNSREETASVSVSTVAVPADWGIDGPRLTRQFVEQLRARGVSDVAWRSGTDRPVDVECIVDGRRPDTFGAHRHARVVAECRVLTPGGSSVVRTTGRDTMAGFPGRGDPPDVRQTALEYAAADALSRAASDVARTVRSRSPAPDGSRNGQTTR